MGPSGVYRRGRWSCTGSRSCRDVVVAAAATLETLESCRSIRRRISSQTVYMGGSQAVAIMTSMTEGMLANQCHCKRSRQRCMDSLFVP